jgi:hypothetical protein
MDEEQQNLLYKYGRPPVDLDQLSQQYDDGAHLLGSNPNMMPVGLFPKPKPRPVAEPPANLPRQPVSILGTVAPPPVQIPSIIDQIPGQSAPATAKPVNPFTEVFSSPDKMEKFALGLQNSPLFTDPAAAKTARNRGMALTNWMRTLEKPSTDPKKVFNQYREATAVGFALANQYSMAGDRETANMLEEALIDWSKPGIPPLPEKKSKGKK